MHITTRNMMAEIVNPMTRELEDTSSTISSFSWGTYLSFAIPMGSSLALPERGEAWSKGRDRGGGGKGGTWFLPPLTSVPGSMSGAAPTR